MILIALLQVYRVNIDGTFGGDEITLRTAAKLFNIEFVNIFTFGRAAG